jgi:hypothetical protein
MSALACAPVERSGSSVVGSCHANTTVPPIRDDAGGGGDDCDVTHAARVKAHAIPKAAARIIPRAAP